MQKIKYYINGIHWWKGFVGWISVIIATSHAYWMEGAQENDSAGILFAPTYNREQDICASHERQYRMDGKTREMFWF